MPNNNETTTKFKVDISELKQEMQEAKRQVALANSEFKAASSALDDWSKSSDGISAKLKQLGTTLDAQEKTLKSLEKQYELTAQEMGEGSKEAESLKIAINNQQAAINKTKREYENYNSALNDVAKAEQIAAETGKDVNEVLEDMKTKTKDATKAAKDAEGGFTVMKGALADLVSKGLQLAIKGAKDLANSFLELGLRADDLNTLSKQSGFSTEELQKMEYAADLIDVSVDSIVSSAKKMKKNMVSESKDTTAAFEQLGVSVRDTATGELRDSTEVFWDVVEALSTVSNETERDTLAMQLFGKSADDLAGIIDDGGEALRELGKEAEEVGAILSQDTLDSANEFNDSVDRMKATAKGVFASIGAEIAKELVPEMETLRKKAQDTAKKIDWSKTLKPLINIIKSFGTAIKNIAEAVLPKLEKVLGFVSKNFKEVSSAVLVGVGAFQAFKAAMAISATISAFNTAVTTSTTAVGLAQKTQILWNAALSANPIGAVLTAVGLLAAGIVALTAAFKDSNGEADAFNTRTAGTGTAARNAAEEYENAKTKSLELAAAFKDTANEAKKDAESFRDAKAAAEEMASAELANIDYTEQLWKELQTLTSANGEVQAGYEGRAKFIVEELNKALGTEYTMNGNIIEQYQQMQSEIEGIIEKKRAQILLDSYQEGYEEAIKNIGKAEKARAEAAQELAAQQQTALAAQKLYNENLEAYQEKFENAKSESEKRMLASDAQRVEALRKNAEIEQNVLNNKSKSYSDLSGMVEDYYSTIDTYENASTLVIQGKTKEAVDALNDLSTGFQTAASTSKLAAEEQKKVLRQQVIDSEINLGIMRAEYENAQAKMTEAEKREAETRIKEAEDEADKAKVEYEKVGGAITQSLAHGLTINKGVVSEAMKDVIDEAIRAAKEAAGIESPSKVIENEIGKNLSLGIGSGVENASNSVTESIKNQVNGIRSAYNDAVGNIAAPLSAKGMVTSGVTNNYTQVINSPTQLNRLDIYRQSKNLLGFVGGAN